MLATVSNIKFDNSVMPYAKLGKGSKALVMIPGISFKKVTDSAEAVEKQYEVLLDEYTIYLFDRKSEIKSGYTVLQMADDLADALNKLGINKADVFGVSQGGQIALSLAYKYKSLVGKLIIGSSAARNTERCAAVLYKWKEYALKNKVIELAESIAETIYSENTLNLYRDMIIKSNADLSETELSQGISIIESSDGFDISNELPQIKAPALIIASKGDKVFDISEAEILAREMNSELYLYGEEYGHAVYDEAPDYPRVMKDFLLR